MYEGGCRTFPRLATSVGRHPTAGYLYLMPGFHSRSSPAYGAPAHFLRRWLRRRLAPSLRVLRADEDFVRSRLHLDERVAAVCYDSYDQRVSPTAALAAEGMS